MVHLVGRVCPHLRVVRRHERIGQRLAKLCVEELFEVARRRRLWPRALLGKVSEDTRHLRLWQPPNVSLHRVTNPPAAHVCRRIALMVQPITRRQQVVEQRVEEAEVREEAVHAYVPAEARLVPDCAREASGLGCTLDQLPIRVSELVQSPRGAQPRRPRANNDYLRVVTERRRRVIIFGEGDIVVCERVDGRPRWRTIMRGAPLPAMADHRFDTGVLGSPVAQARHVHSKA